MTYMEKAKEVTRLYNSWTRYVDAHKNNTEILAKARNECFKAKYLTNGYEHSKVFGAWLSPEEFEAQIKFVYEKVQKYEKLIKEVERAISEILEA